MPRVIWSSGNCTLYVRREGERERLARGGREVCEKSRLIRARAKVLLRRCGARGRREGERWEKERKMEEAPQEEKLRGGRQLRRRRQRRRRRRRRRGRGGRARELQQEREARVEEVETKGRRGRREKRVCENAISGLFSTRGPHRETTVRAFASLRQYIRDQTSKRVGKYVSYYDRTNFLTVRAPAQIGTVTGNVTSGRSSPVRPTPSLPPYHGHFQSS